MPECVDCGDEYTLDDGKESDGWCHDCAHAIAENRNSAMVSARDLTIRDLREALRRYGEHDMDCAADVVGAPGDAPCTCGLEKAYGRGDR